MSEQKELKRSVMRLLVRREYCWAELERKFIRKYAVNDIEQVLSALVDDGYLSDSRYAESFVRHRVGQRYGLQRIKMELKHKGVSEELIAEALLDAKTDWFLLAVSAWKKRFHELPEKSDRKAYAKQVRYLLQRGFSMEQAVYVLNEYSDEDLDMDYPIE